MKRKFISALLFGALLAASTSTFVSCAKDYDGDIAELREKITSNATDLTSLVDEKVKNVQTEIDALKAQQSALDAAYKAADEALDQAIKDATNDAQGYADIQAAEAQRAAIAAAQEMVNTAVTSLQSGLDAANAKIDAQGKTVESLLEADKELTKSISTAQSRADAAYALAEQANNLAGTNEGKIANLTNDLSTIKSSLDKLEKETIVALQNDISKVLQQSNTNKTNIEGLTTQLNDLKTSNEKALKDLSDKDTELENLITDNQSKIEEALKKEEKARIEADSVMNAAIKKVEDNYTALAGKVTSAETDITTLKNKASQFETDITSLKNRADKLESDVKKLNEEVITKINSNLSNLFQNLDNLITGIIVQDASQIKMFYAQVKSSGVDATNTSSLLTILERGTVFFPYKGAEGAAKLTANKYNVETNIGKLYFTLNPNTIDFTNNADLYLENSLGDAPADITVGTVESASGHLITTRAAATKVSNGLYQASLTNNKAVMDAAPSYKNSFALYTEYQSKNANDSTINHRVYSKYEVNIAGTEATAEVTPKLSTTSKNVTELTEGNTGWQFNSTDGKLTGTLTLGTTCSGGTDKAYAKYVEVYAVANPSGKALEKDALTNAKNSFKNNSTGINEVLKEAQDKETDNLFNEITIGVGDAYNGYTFTLRYFIQQYDGTVRMETKDVRFSKPMFASENIKVTATPDKAEGCTATVSGTELAKLAYMTGTGNTKDYQTWKANTKTIEIVAGKPDAKITSVSFAYSNSKLDVKKGDTEKPTDAGNITSNKVTGVTVTYNAKDFTPGSEYKFDIVSKDNNGNEVTRTSVTFVMERPTSADNVLRPNPAFIPNGNGILEAWAVTAGDDKASYTMIQPFNNPYETSWAVRLDVAEQDKYKDDKGVYKAYAPDNYTFVPKSASDGNFKLTVPNAAVKFGKEHTYTMLYGPQYFGLTNLWSNKYNGYRFEDNGAKLYDVEHSFKIKLKSPIAYATAAAYFKEKGGYTYTVGYPNEKLTIGLSDIVSDDPATSANDPIKYFTDKGVKMDTRIKSKTVTLKDEQYKSLFKSFNIEQTDATVGNVTWAIVIKTVENTTTGGTALVGGTVEFSLDVTDQFGNTVGIPFKVKVTNATSKE